MLKGVTKRGTAKSLRNFKHEIAGKTGTAQVGYGTDQVDYISSFVGYFPSENPIYTCIVVIHKPNKNKGYYGSKVAAPVFKRIAKNQSAVREESARVPARSHVNVHGGGFGIEQRDGVVQGKVGVARGIR